MNQSCVFRTLRPARASRCCRHENLHARRRRCGMKCVAGIRGTHGALFLRDRQRFCRAVQACSTASSRRMPPAYSLRCGRASRRAFALHVACTHVKCPWRCSSVPHSHKYAAAAGSMHSLMAGDLYQCWVVMWICWGNTCENQIDKIRFVLSDRAR